MVKHHSKCWKCSLFCSRHMFTLFLVSKIFFNLFVSARSSISCCNRNSWLLRELCQRCWRYCSSRLKSSTTSAETQDLPRDFLSLTPPVPTNLWLISVMWVSIDGSWIIKSRYLARYSWFNTVIHVHSHSFLVQK